MFGAPTVSRGLSFTKVLSGINKTLSIANQVIPIYQQAKPMLQNAKSAFQVLKEFSRPVSKENTASNQTKMITQASMVQANKKTNATRNATSSFNKPVFFL